MTNNKLIAITEIERKLAQASDPKETFKYEGISKAEQALAKEQRDYEKVIEWGRIYLLAKRKTTELIAPGISHGGYGSNQYISKSKGNDLVTLADYGFEDEGVGDE